MANNIEWSHASLRPSIVDPDDLPGSYEGLNEGEIGVWMGSDGANILYGTNEQVIAWAKALVEIAENATPYSTPEPITMTQDRLDYLRAEAEDGCLSMGELVEIQGEFEKIDPRTLRDLPENATASDMLEEIEERIS